MDNSVSNSVSNTVADPQFKAGRSLVDAGRLEEAVDFFSALLEVRVGVLGDEMSPALAPLYYEYGNALLYNAEESGAVFGDAITDAEKKRALAIVDAAQNGSAAESQVDGKPDDAVTSAGTAQGDTSTGGNGTSESGENPTIDQEAEQDLILAWENLEIARRLYNALELTDEIRTLMAKVHLRLGDLQMVNGMYNEAAEDFATCLAHRLALPSKHARGVADAYVRRAQALFYASTLKDAKKDELVTQSLEQYRLAAGVLEKMLSATTSASVSSAPTPTSASTAPSSTKDGETDAQAPATRSTEELQDVLDTIRETIETMSSGKDMEALAEYKSGAVSTSVGFGSSSGGASALGNGDSGETTTIGFGGKVSNGAAKASQGSSESGVDLAPTSSVPISSGGVTENVLQVKRKVRPTASRALPRTGDSAEQAGTGDDREGSVKKARTEG